VSYKHTPPYGPQAQGVLFEKWITKKELAQHLGVSESFINKLMTEEALPHLKVGRAVRFLLSNVDAWFERKGYKQ
jgi:excisionase family DNA binding protein